MSATVTQLSKEHVLEVRDLDAGYGEVAVVKGLNLHVRAGEIVALFGPNGAGKTTTLLTIAGDLPTLGGEVLWHGKPIKLPLHRRARLGLALVPEERSVLMSMSVRDNLLLGSGGIETAVELFPELKPLLSRRAGLLSGGEQQMLTLARALATQPTALLIDELSLGLAPIIVDRLLARLTDIAKSRNVAVLLVEQQARRGLKVADRWYLMRRGRVVGEGDTESGAAGLEAAYLADHDQEHAPA
jgi:branched-chain amino acid transport system ATP-binding protein